VFSGEDILLSVIKALKEQDIFCRRYFYPSLNELKYMPYQRCSVSENISRRVLCLPLFYEMGNEVIEEVCDIICSIVE
jgi:dTDP-4-amino-4,6-dideoxygalactose transaminase